MVSSCVIVINAPHCFPIFQLSNPHCRCQFYEVSAAENYVGVSLAFQSLMREARAAQQLRTLPVRRKTGPALSKMIGMVFGRGGDKGADRKKRPSLSI